MSSSRDTDDVRLILFNSVPFEGDVDNDGEDDGDDDGDDDGNNDGGDCDDGNNDDGNNDGDDDGNNDDGNNEDDGGGDVGGDRGDVTLIGTFRPWSSFINNVFADIWFCLTLVFLSSSSCIALFLSVSLIASLSLIALSLFIFRTDDSLSA